MEAPSQCQGMLGCPGIRRSTFPVIRMTMFGRIERGRGLRLRLQPGRRNSQHQHVPPPCSGIERRRKLGGWKSPRGSGFCLGSPLPGSHCVTGRHRPLASRNDGPLGIEPKVAPLGQICPSSLQLSRTGNITHKHRRGHLALTCRLCIPSQPSGVVLLIHFTQQTPYQQCRSGRMQHCIVFCPRNKAFKHSSQSLLPH
ncbi:hypothetical protein VTK26DRAFT_1530 [Humicola hyalothermophila]